MQTSKIHFKIILGIIIAKVILSGVIWRENEISIRYININA